MAGVLAPLRLEHTFRLFKRVLGWTAPKIRDPHAADRWTWLIIACYAQLRLARPLAADLRRPAARRPVAVRLTYPHDGGDFATAVHRCTGVGKCVTDSGGVMCPSYLATRDEKDSTRGRARVLQEMVNGTLVTGGWRAPELRESLELCLACKGCLSDCPTGVDMATYKAEVLHHRYAGRLRPRTPAGRTRRCRPGASAPTCATSTRCWPSAA